MSDEDRRRHELDDLSRMQTIDPPDTRGDDDPPPPPQRGDRYRLGTLLGEGGMAVVHVAHDSQLERQVAVKQLRPGLQAKAEARQRFTDEAVIMAGLDHPGAIPVYELGRLPSGEHFYAMKRVQGKTLLEELSARSDDELRSHQGLMHFIDVFERVCQTVAAAHDRDIIHRDLKPDNVMVDDLGAVYVMDWGLAKKVERSEDGSASDSGRTQLGAVMGTPAYMAPEQASGRAARSDTQTDVFSLGVMLFEILTGRNPFKGRDAHESMQGVMHHAPDPPRKLNRRVPRELSAICMKALEKDPLRRYRTARELAEDIRRFREHRTVSAVDPRPIDRLINWARRRPTVAAVAATVSVIATVGLLAFGAQVSLENAMVAQGYDVIDAAEARITALEVEIETASRSIEASGVTAERRRLEHELRGLIAERDVQRSLLNSMAMAILGFTVFSPDERAQTVVRDDWFREIEDLTAEGRIYHAEATTRVALEFSRRGGLIEFSDADVERLEQILENLESRIAAERAAAESVPPGAPPEDE